jgi:hypothetical protein
MRIRGLSGRAVALLAVLAVVASACGSADGHPTTQRSSVVRPVDTPVLHKRLQLNVVFNRAYDFHGRAVITGGFSDTGTSEPADAAGKYNATGPNIKFNMRRGSLLARVTHFTTLHRTNNRLCTRSGPDRIVFALTDGTGQYTGLAGTLRGTITLAAVYPQVTSGPHKGWCIWRVSTSPRTSIYTLTGQAKATVSSTTSG